MTNKEYHMNLKLLLEVVYLTAITVCLSIVGFYIPALMIFTVFLSAIPLVIITVRTNPTMVILSAVLAFFVLALFTGKSMMAGITVLVFGVAAYATGYALKRKWDFGRVLVIAAGGYLFSMLVTIVFLNKIEGVNQIQKLILEPMQGYLDEMQSKMGELMQMYGDAKAYEENLGAIKDNFTAAKEVISLLVPGFFIVVSAFWGYMTLAFSQFILNRIGHDYRYLPAFYGLKVNRGATTVFAVSLILSMFISKQIVSAALVNITFILSIVLFVCGLSVCDFYVKRARIPGVFRILIYMVVFGIMSILAVRLPFLHPVYILVLVALGDSIFNFRKFGNAKK